MVPQTQGRVCLLLAQVRHASRPSHRAAHRRALSRNHGPCARDAGNGYHLRECLDHRLRLRRALAYFPAKQGWQHPGFPATRHGLWRICRAAHGEKMPAVSRRPRGGLAQPTGAELRGGEQPDHRLGFQRRLSERLDHRRRAIPGRCAILRQQRPPHRKQFHL